MNRHINTTSGSLYSEYDGGVSDLTNQQHLYNYQQQGQYQQQHHHEHLMMSRQHQQQLTAQQMMTGNCHPMMPAPFTSPTRFDGKTSQRILPARYRKAKPAYGCPSCGTLFNTPKRGWTSLLQHMKRCCPTQLGNRGGMQQRCMLGNQQCVVPGHEGRGELIRMGIMQETPPSLPPPPASPEVQKNMIGEKLYLLINRTQPEPYAGKITGMLLGEMDVPELQSLLQSPAALEGRIQEALQLLEAHTMH